MGFRFRKKLKFGKGLGLNLSKSGISLSAGVRGASFTLGGKGLFANAGLPGTGISFRSKMGSKGRKRQKQNNSKESSKEISQIKVSMRINDDGSIELLNENFQKLPDEIVKKVIKLNKDVLSTAIETHIQQANQDYEACMSVHKHTPQKHTLHFPIQPPSMPVLEKINFLKKFFGLAKAEENINQIRLTTYEKNLSQWKLQRDRWPALCEKAKNGDLVAMSIIIEIVLSTIIWPKETIVNFDFSDDLKILALDIDLPELENMPKTILTRAATGLKINVKRISEAQIKHDYAKLVHGIIFRIIGECFSALEYLNEIRISGFTQRLSKTTGTEVNDYIISVKIEKEKWAQLDLNRVDIIEPIEALTQFDLIRDMKRNSELKAIQPMKLD